MTLSLILLLAPLLLVFWIWQWTLLMATADGAFPGRFDKLLWCAGFLLCPPLVPVAFLAWRQTQDPEPYRAAEAVLHPLYLLLAVLMVLLEIRATAGWNLIGLDSYLFIAIAMLLKWRRMDQRTRWARTAIYGAYLLAAILACPALWFWTRSLN